MLIVSVKKIYYAIFLKLCAYYSYSIFVYLLYYVLEKAMAPHSSTLAWKIPWTEEPGGLQSMGWQRVGHDWVTSLSLSCIGEGNGSLLQCSCLENPRARGAWWAAIYGVAQNRIWLKWLSSSIHNPLGRIITWLSNWSSQLTVSLFKFIPVLVLGDF